MEEIKELEISGLRDAAGRLYFRINAGMDDGPKLSKILSYEAMMKVLDRTYRVEEEWIHVGQLPQGYLDCRKSSSGNWSVKVYRPEQTRAFMLKQEGQKMPLVFMIPWPAMLFEVNSNGNGNVCIVKGAYDRVKKEYWSGKLKSYSYPFGNVSSYGRICMGNIAHKMKDMCDVDRFVEAFYDGVTNFDYINSKKSFKNGMGQMEALQKIQQRKVFPYSWLYEEPFSFAAPYERSRSK